MNFEPQLKTCAVLAEARGYTDFVALNPPQACRFDLMLLATATSTEGPVQILATLATRVSVKLLRHALQREAARILLLCGEGLTTFAEKELTQGAARGTSSAQEEGGGARAPVRLEVFTFAQLAFPVIHHALVPKHEALTQPEAAAVLAMYGVTLTELPKIHHQDPVIRFLGLARGTVVQITRSFGILEPHCYYRLVI
jgi:DNA-directed RNA polymerase subunit H (RpoH/RPB5)